MSKIYLSADYERKAEVRALAELLRSWGHHVVSTWHDQADGDDEVESASAGGCAEQDLSELHLAEVHVALTRGGKSRGGHHAEFGASIVLGHRLVLVGPREQHFHCLTRVERVRTPAELPIHLGRSGR